MDIDDVYEFANINPLCYLATAEGDQPRVRAFAMWCAKDKGFYFHTSTAKDVYRQIKAHPKVEVCFYATQSGAMMRITGEAKILQDIDLKRKLLDDQEYLKQMFQGPEDPTLALFRIQNGVARFWTVAENEKERDSEKISF